MRRRTQRPGQKPGASKFLPDRQAGQPALRLAGLPAYPAKTPVKRIERFLNGFARGLYSTQKTYDNTSSYISMSTIIL